jgi:hypothetical protein
LGEPLQLCTKRSVFVLQHMPRRLTKPPEPERPWWRVHLLRGARAQSLGTVRARDEAEAIAEAMTEFELQPWQRSRLLVRPY